MQWALAPKIQIGLRYEWHTRMYSLKAGLNWLKIFLTDSSVCVYFTRNSNSSEPHNYCLSFCAEIKPKSRNCKFELLYALKAKNGIHVSR